MKQLDLVRRHIAGSMLRLRSYISCLPGNEDAVNRLRGKEGEERIARIVGFIMQELGHEPTDTPVENASSHVRRAVQAIVGRVRGE